MEPNGRGGGRAATLPPPQARERRWCVPPVMLDEHDQALDGAHVLDEVRGPTGLLLWQSLRDVTLWATTPPRERAGLFAPGASRGRLDVLLSAGVDPELEVALTSLVPVVGSPGTADAEVVALVCMRLSRWADARGARVTALSFAQAAALTAAESAASAVTVGRMALRARRSARAETWLRRAVGLARRTEEWTPYAEAFVELGALHAARGAPVAARRHYVQALRAARRHGLSPARGSALHGLFRLAVRAGEGAEADRFGRLAMRAYGRSHPQLPTLLHELAALWIGSGTPGRAAAVLQKLVALRPARPGQPLTLALLARAAAAAGQERVYEESWTRAWSLLAHEDDGGPALLELARAAAGVRDWSRVGMAARRAAAAAEKTGETETLRAAARLLGGAREAAS